MTPVVYFMVWTYATLLLGWWVGRHWDCVRACPRWCVSDERVDRGVEGAEWADAYDRSLREFRDVLAAADDVQREAQP